jgi:hypothetical protein
MAKLTAAASDRPATRPTGMKAHPAPTATMAISRATRMTWRSSGLSSGLTRWLSAAIRPSSVCMPVAVVIARASPPVHVVPLNSRFSASSSGTRLSPASADRVTGADSPVTVDRSTSTLPDRMRPSAQIRSPSLTASRSPGTSSRAGISSSVPSRITRARSGRKAARASTARSASISCTKAKTAFRTMTVAMAMASRGVPLAQASAAAAASSRARGWNSCCASSRGQRRPVRRASSFGP